MMYMSKPHQAAPHKDYIYSRCVMILCYVSDWTGDKRGMWGQITIQVILEASFQYQETLAVLLVFVVCDAIPH